MALVSHAENITYGVCIYIYFFTHSDNTHIYS